MPDLLNLAYRIKFPKRNGSRAALSISSPREQGDTTDENLQG